MVVPQKKDCDVYDITIVGAGPTGLFATFYAGMRKMKTCIIDSLPQVGGQLNALYPEKYIYDMPGFPAIQSKKLVEELWEQAQLAKPTLHLNQNVVDIESYPNKENREYFILHTKTQKQVASKTVLLALGMGAFHPRPLKVSGMEPFMGKNVRYAPKPLHEYAGKNVLIVGGGDSALDWTLALGKKENKKPCSALTLIHRGGRFSAHEATVEAVHNTPANIWMNHELKSLASDNTKLKAHLKQNLTGETKDIIVDEVLICVGYIARLSLAKDMEITMNKNSIQVDDRMETNIPGIFSAGDVVNHPSKLKLIATGVGEAAIAVNLAKTLVDPKARAFPGHSTDVLKKEKS